MYEKHFSFKCKPFDLTPNPDFLFMSAAHKKALTYLDYGIKEKVGFILLTGEIGSGKTTIVRNIIKNLNSNIKLSRINNTKVSSEQLISMINEDFGLDVKGKDKTALLSDLNRFLIEQYSKGFQPMLLIDEAQNLTPDLLEEMRLLSNLETDRAKLLQIILVGQPELKKTLMLPKLTQLRQRITINYHITPLTMDETRGYIKHRLSIAGNPDAIDLDQEVLEITYKFSRGIPRLINILCDFALLSTYVEGKKKVDAEIVREVARDLEAFNYWNETQDIVTEMKQADGDSGLSQALDMIGSRLIKLEERISQIDSGVLPSLTSLSEKILKLEKELSELSKKAASKDDKKSLNELFDRVARLEQMCPLFEYRENRKNRKGF
jgi:putative secretion ATPase (PEP-CTERM system associated)